MRLLRPCYSHSSKGNWSLRILGFCSDAVSGARSPECDAASLCYWCPRLQNTEAVLSSRVVSKPRAPPTQRRGATLQTNRHLKLKFTHVKKWERGLKSLPKTLPQHSHVAVLTLASIWCKFHDIFRYFLLCPRQEKGKLYQFTAGIA
jgi:hypothetical protein